jgi:hypothetical protein
MVLKVNKELIEILGLRQLRILFTSPSYINILLKAKKYQDYLFVTNRIINKLPLAESAFNSPLGFWGWH